jgi:hypothetical protein
VRTRGDIADFINSAADPVAIKQEFIGPTCDSMDVDGNTDVEITAVFSGNRSIDYENEEEDDETLLDEQGEYADHVVSCEDGEEESEEDDAPKKFSGQVGTLGSPAPPGPPAPPAPLGKQLPWTLLVEVGMGRMAGEMRRSLHNLRMPMKEKGRRK